MQNKPSKWVSGYKHGPAASYTQITRMGLFLNVSTSKFEPLDSTWDNLHSGGMFISDDNKIYFRDETNKDIYINSPADNVLALYASSGVGIGTDSAGDLHASANNLVVGGGTGSNGITIHSAADGSSAIYFADGTSGAAEYDGFIYQNHDSGFLALGSGGGGSIDLQITGSGSDVTVSAGNLVIGTAGKGIDFSIQTATSASGATTTAELLDHYEEGTFTPTLSANSGSAGSVAYSTQVGTYTRIGNLITVAASMTMSNLGSWSGVCFLSGLPFTIVSDADNVSMGTLNMAEVDVGSTFQAVTVARRGESNLGVYFTTDDGALSELQISALETTAAFRFTVTYRV